MRDVVHPLAFELACRRATPPYLTPRLRGDCCSRGVGHPELVPLLHPIGSVSSCAGGVLARAKRGFNFRRQVLGNL